MNSLINVDPTTDVLWKELTANANASVFTSSPWIDTIVETYGFDVDATVLRDAESEPVAGLACATVSDLRGDRQISLPFCDYADPIVETDEQWNAVIEPYLARDIPLYVRVLDSQAPRRDPRFEPVDELAWHTADLEGDEADLLNRMHPQFRQALRSAHRRGVTMRFGFDLDDVRMFYELHCQTRMRKYRLLPQPWSFFENLWKRFAALDGIVVGLAEHEGDVTAGALYLVWRRVMYYKFGASLADRLSARPNELLAWRSMLLARELGCTKYDWGVSDLDQPGLIRYKRKCASDERSVVVLRHLPPGYERPGYAEEADRTLTELTRALTADDVPAPVAQRAGDALYRFFAR